MRKLLVLAFAAFFLGWSQVVLAKCPDGQVLKKIGNVQTDDANITTQGQDVHFVFVDCSGTACTAAFYNGDTLGVTANADLVLEAGAAANGSFSLDLTNSPLYFSDGVTFVDDANVDAASVYGCQNR